MSLQLLRGQQAKSPLRAGQEKPAASTVLQRQNAKQIGKLGKANAKPVLRFPVGEETRAFYRRFYPGTTTAEWNDWHWQFQARIRSLADLEKVFTLSEDERAAVAGHKGPLPVGITPYYASLMGRDDPQEPLRRTHIQTRAESILSPGESDDPLSEDHDTAAPGIVHRYPDRVLFLTTGTCSTYCRYCTRARAVGNPGGEYQFSPKQWEPAIGYIEEHTEGRDVLLAGGDPLSSADETLADLLGR
ncbi:MAG: KamA family radical SAM protein, partial [Rhizomicrobium sp.]